MRLPGADAPGRLAYPGGEPRATEAALPEQEPRATIAERLKGTGRRAPLSIALSFAVLTCLAAGAVWLATGALQPERPRPPRPARAAASPPIRLDTLPAAPRSARATEKRGPASAAPVIGVGTDEFAGESDDATVEVDGDKPDADVASDADIKRDLAELARENARIEAALRGQGPASGSGDLAWPVRGGSITSPFGQRWGRLHAGVDIGVPTGSNVYASDGGRVVISGPTGGYGNYICIQHTRSLSTCYGHNSRLGVRKGQSVRKGAVIAKSGCTGSCSGPHVHYEVRVGGKPVNPMRYF